MSRLVTKGGMLLASPQSAASDEVDCCRREGRHRLFKGFNSKNCDNNSHLKEGERRMRLRGREGMVEVVVDREEGEGFSENLVKM